MTAQPITYLTPESFQKKYVGNPHWFIVGVTGHRDLRSQDEASIKVLVTQKLDGLRKKHLNKKLLLCSALAPGADQWVAQCLAKEDKLVVVETLPWEEAEKYTFDIDHKAIEEARQENKFSPQDEAALRAKEPVFAYFIQASQGNERVRLYYDSQRGFTSESRNEQYVLLGRFLAEHCDHLIALWDGVDGGGLGGTSDVVRMWVHGKGLDGKPVTRKNATQTLHQLVLPRGRNHFPVGRRFAEAQRHLPVALPYTWVETERNLEKRTWWKKIKDFESSNRVWILLGVVIFGVLIWIETRKTFTWEDFGALLGLGGVYALAWWAYRKWHFARSLLLQFIYPMILAFLVLGLGMYGFVESIINFDGYGNAFFSAANLITLNSSIFDATKLDISKPLEVARLLGGFLAGYAFVLAFSFAIGKEGYSRLGFFTFRKFNWLRQRLFTVVVSNDFKNFDSVLNLTNREQWVFKFKSNWLRKYPFTLVVSNDSKTYDLLFDFAVRNQRTFKIFLLRKINWLLKRPFTVVVGNGTKALDLVLDLTDQGNRVLMLDEGQDPLVETLLKERRVWYLRGNASSRTDLQKTHLDEAKEVYLMCESDEDNFRTTQEVDEWLLTQKHKPLRYVHLHDLRLRGLMHQISRRSEQLRTFSIHENTTRRLLTRYPVDRFWENSTAKVARVVILGFGELARELALTCLRLGHYSENRYLTVTVYHTAAEAEVIAQFEAQHPELFRQKNIFRQNPYYRDTQRYTFWQNLPEGEAPIRFELLPEAESQLRDPDFSLYRLVQPKAIVTLYACLDSGIASASMLGMLLPRIQWLKQQATQTDVQAFCFYNFPDQDEEAYVETQLNALAPYVPVFCFGNFLQECAIQAIRNEAMNQVAKRLAMLYACLYNDRQVFELPQLNWLADCVMEIDKELKEQEWPSYNDQMIKKTHLLLQRLNNFVQTARQNGGEDPSVPWMNELWNSITEDERESNIQAADHAWVKFRQMNKNPFALTAPTWEDKELELLGELEHRRWNAEKLTLGWLPFAEKALWKSQKQTLKSQKLHHFLMPFDKLPDDERNKDHTQAVGVGYFFEYLFKDVRP